MSAATIRNEMAELADAGLLEQPHTSAGRVPSAQAFRMYVEQLSGGAATRLWASKRGSLRGPAAGRGARTGARAGARLNSRTKRDFQLSSACSIMPSQAKA